MASVRGFNSLPRLFRLKSKSCRSDRKLDTEVETPSCHAAPGGCVSAAEYRPYLGAIAGILLAECWIESFLITISSPLNGGAAFAGKSGRKTANACETNAMETIAIGAAHFMVGALIKFQTPGKKNFRMIITDEERNDFILIQPISGFGF